MKNRGFVLLFVFASLAMSASAYRKPFLHKIIDALADAKALYPELSKQSYPTSNGKGGYFWREIFDKYWHNLAAQEFGITMAKMDDGTSQL